MTIKGHVLTSLPIALYLYKSNHLLDSTLVVLLLFYFGFFTGVALPDIDEPRSFIGRRFVVIAIIVNIVNRHRGITHSIYAVLMPLLFGYLLSDTSSFLLYGVSFGILTHIAGDMLTNGGVFGFLSPFYSGRVALLPSFLRFETGGLFEHIIIVALFLFNIFLFLNYFGLWRFV